MKLKIRETKPEENEETLELWLEQDKDGDIFLLSRKNGRTEQEFIIFSDGSWTKYTGAHLGDSE